MADNILTPEESNKVTIMCEGGVEHHVRHAVRDARPRVSYIYAQKLVDPIPNGTYDSTEVNDTIAIREEKVISIRSPSVQRASSTNSSVDETLYFHYDTADPMTEKTLEPIWHGYWNVMEMSQDLEKRGVGGEVNDAILEAARELKKVLQDTAPSETVTGRN